jgi:hypothetical protein
MTPSAFDAVHRLAQKVLEGDVVFFIGAGFSVDSEGNTGQRQIKRLLIRLLAFIRTLDGAAGTAEPVAESILPHLRESFGLKGSAFGGGPAPGPLRFLKSDLRRLTDRYFETNDWFCDAFGRLLAVGRERWHGRIPELCATLAGLEEAIRLSGTVKEDEPGVDPDDNPLPARDQRPPLDAVPLGPIDPELFAAWPRGGDPTGRMAGKALFLDTMGFRDSAVMAGNPSEPDLEAVAASYVGRLLPRHHVIARLAREGLCTTTITTNFDLLLEGAYRLAGFSEGPPSEFLPHTTFSQYARVASAAAFFTEGKPHRTSVLVKMHGCAERYRRLRETGKRGAWGPYLRAMVFTYREIQNWREDSWAADFLRTLLRTRTVVFCGYSLQDPVVHDTFRTVYEEMAHLRREGGPVDVPITASPASRDESVAKDAPAFFFGRGAEFHGLAVLQAASKAIGAVPAEFGEHPNHIPFFYAQEAGFPHLDELFRWLFHLFFRLRQRESLHSDLRRVSTLLLGAQQRDAVLAQARQRFQEVFDRELQMAEGWGRGGPGTDGGARFELDRTCAWTESFHLGLLREFAASEVLHRRQGPGTELALLRRFPWYYPAMQDSGLTAWGAVVELALRRLLSGGSAGRSSETAPRLVEPARCQQPTVLYQPRSGGTAPWALTIHLAGFQRLDRTARIQGHAVRRTFWRLDAADAPWRRDPVLSNQPGPHPEPRRRTFKECHLPAPPASVIWDWATRLTNPTEEDEAWLWSQEPEEEAPQ